MLTINFYKKNISIVIISLIFLYISIINAIPFNSFLASGDIYQPINFKIFIDKYISNYTIDELGLVSPLNGWKVFFYPFIYLKKLFNFNFSFFSSIIMFIFLISSYISFRFSLITFYPSLSKNDFYVSIFSFLYSINTFTVYIFWYTWGYSFYLSIYFFIPALTAIFYNFLNIDGILNSLKYLIKFSFIFFLSNLAFTNISWLVHLSIFFFSIFCFFIIFKKNAKVIILKNIIFFSFFLLMISPSLISSLTYTFSYLSSESSIQSYINPYQYVRDQIVSLKDIFLIHNLVNLFQIPNFLKSSSTFYYVILFCLLLKYFSKSNKFLVSIYLFNILISLFLLTKGYFLNSDFINYLFAETYLYGLRSSEKIYYILPLLILTIIFDLTYSSQNKYLKKIITLTLILINLSNIYPILKGNIYNNFNVSINSDENNLKIIKYLNSDILKISEIVNSDTDNNFRIAFLPYNKHSSEGWAFYKSLGHNGTDPMHSLFKNSVIGSGTFYTNQSQIINRNWNKSLDSDKWNFNLLRELGIKYIIFNKDTHEFFVNESIDKLNYYLDKNLINTKFIGNNYNLYEINTNFINGLVYSPDYEYYSNQNNKYLDIDYLRVLDFDSKYLYFENKSYNKELKNLFDKFNLTNLKKIEYFNPFFKRLNASYIRNYTYENNIFTFDSINHSQTFNIVLNFRESSLWKIRCVKNCLEFSSQKISSNIHNNSWVINSQETLVKLQIYNILDKILTLNWLFVISILIILQVILIRK